MRKAFICIFLVYFGCLQQYVESQSTSVDHNPEEKANESAQSKIEWPLSEHGMGRQADDNRKESNKHPNQQATDTATEILNGADGNTLDNNLALDILSPTKCPAIREKQGSSPSSDDPCFPEILQKLLQSAYQLGLDVNIHTRMYNSMPSNTNTSYVHDNKPGQNYSSHEDQPQVSADDGESINHRNSEGEKTNYTPDDNREEKSVIKRAAPSLTEIRDDTRINEHAHNLHSSENEYEIEKIKRIEDLIQAHTDALKEAIREIIREGITKRDKRDINWNDNVAHDIKQHVRNHKHSMPVNINIQGQSKDPGNILITRRRRVRGNSELQHPSADSTTTLPTDLTSFSETSELSQPDHVNTYDDVFGGLTHSSDEVLVRVKRV